MNMDVLLAALVEQKGSDLFITVDAPDPQGQRASGVAGRLPSTRRRRWR
jgi:Tfp pilus assembly ATPase PilU